MPSWALADESGWKVDAVRDGDSVTVAAAAARTVVTVRSKTGIGAARLTPPAAGWPPTVVLRLHLRGLENLELTSSAAKLRIAVSSHGDQATRVVRLEGNEEQPVARDGPLWVEAKRVTGDKPEDGYFEVSLPRSSLPGEPRPLELRWIDFYR